MRRQPIVDGLQGKIVNFADWAVDRPYKNFLPYMIAKGGVATMTRALLGALEDRPNVTVWNGVRVVAVDSEGPRPSVTVRPDAPAGLQVLLPGESAVSMADAMVSMASPRKRSSHRCSTPWSAIPARSSSRVGKRYGAPFGPW